MKTSPKNLSLLTQPITVDSQVSSTDEDRMSNDTDVAAKSKTVNDLTETDTLEDETALKTPVSDNNEEEGKLAMQEGTKNNTPVAQLRSVSVATVVNTLPEQDTPLILREPW